MVFYYVWNKTCDDLLLHFLRNKDVSSAESVLKVFGQVHPGSVMAKTSPDVSGIDLMRLYIENDAVKASKLKMTLEAMLEAEEEAKRAQEAREVAHGAKSDE